MSLTERPEFIAVDWGTSHLRAWAIDAGGAVLDQVATDDGMGTLAPDAFEPALLSGIDGWLHGRTPVVACGMVGARQGWQEVGYVAVPARPHDLRPERIAALDARLDISILPGLSQARPPDVMRGEETQIAGFLVEEPDFDGVLCLPGTHTKWVRISAGEVVSFQTFMTGELFALAATRSVLRHSVTADTLDAPAFAEAVSDSVSRPERLASALFSIRAAATLDGVAAEVGRARLSGTLIGAELAAARPYWLGQSVAIIGAGAIGALYRDALQAQGVTPEIVDAQAATLRGLCRFHQSMAKASST